MLISHAHFHAQSFFRIVHTYRRGPRGGPRTTLNKHPTLVGNGSGKIFFGNSQQDQVLSNCTIYIFIQYLFLPWGTFF